MSWQPKTQDNLIKQLIREQNKLRDVVYRTQFGHFSGGGVGGLGGFGSGGALGSQTINHYHPITTKVSNIKGDDSVDSTDGYSHIRADNTIIVCEEAGSGNTPSDTNPQIKWIDQTLFDGTLLILTPKEGKTLTLIAGGNINISSNTTVTSDEIIYLIYLDEHPSSGSGTGGSYNLLKMTSGGGGGSTSFIGFTADDDLSMGTYNIDGVDQLKFSTAESAQQDLATTDWGIESYDDGSGYGDANHLGMLYQVPSGKNHRFKIGSGIDLEISGDGLKFPETHGTPSANGTIYFDGTHIKCRTNSGLKSLSDIGTGGSGGGATRELDNLQNVALNTTLGLNDNQINGVSDMFFNSSGTGDATIQGTTSGLLYNTNTSGDYHYFQTQGATKFRVKTDRIEIVNGSYQLYVTPTSTGIDFDTPNVTNADYNLMFSGSSKHRFFTDGDYWIYGTINWISPSTDAPSDTSTVQRYVPVQVGGTTYRIKLYQ